MLGRPLGGLFTPYGQTTQSIKAARHQRQLDVAMDVQGYRAAQSIHVKEINPILDVVLDQHVETAGGGRSNVSRYARTSIRVSWLSTTR